MADQDAGDRIHHQHGSLFGALLGLGQNEVGDAAGLLIHTAGHVEIGKLETDRRPLFRRGGSSGVDQRVQPREKPVFAVLAPFFGIEQGPHRGGRALGGDVGRRQRQSARPAEHHLVGDDLGGDIVGIGKNHHAVHGFEQRQLDEILPLDEAAGRRRRGDDDECIAGVGIDQPVHRTGIGQRHADIGERGIGDVAQHRQRQRRALAAIGKRQRPLRAVGTAFALERGYLWPVETNADGLPLLQRQPADIADDGSTLGADRLDIDRRGLVEHHPHGVGPAEQRRGRRRRKGEGHAKGVAVAPRLDGSSLVLFNALLRLS